MAGVSPHAEKTKQQAHDISGVPGFWAVPVTLSGLVPSARCSFWRRQRQAQHKASTEPICYFSTFIYYSWLLMASMLGVWERSAPLADFHLLKSQEVT